MTTHPISKKQEGFSLFMVLIIMLVLAFLVIAAVQTFNTESQLSANDADYKSAMSAAETGLRAGETEIADFSSTTKFTVACTQGLCVPAGGIAPIPSSQGSSEMFSVDAALRQGQCSGDCSTPAWKRSGNNMMNASGNSVAVLRADYPLFYDTANYSAPPRYIIEYLGMTAENNTYTFRVTARAWGKNANTVVTVQSYVEAALSD